MKRFENPEIQVSMLVVEDVITASTTCEIDNPNCPKDTGMG